MGQVAQALSAANIQPIFAVTSAALPVYQVRAVYMSDPQPHPRLSQFPQRSILCPPYALLPDPQEPIFLEL